MASTGYRGSTCRAGLDAYNRNGLIHRHATQAEARAGIVAEWKGIERGCVDRDAVERGIETLTNAERIARRSRRGEVFGEANYRFPIPFPERLELTLQGQERTRVR
jgi:hypothetical protein